MSGRVSPGSIGITDKWERYGINWPIHGVYFVDGDAPSGEGDSPPPTTPPDMLPTEPSGDASSASTDKPPAEPESWQSQFLKDTEFHDNPSLKTIPDVKTLAKNYINQQSLIGKKGILPKDDATPEERAAALDELTAKLGRPETPDNYEIARPEMPPGLSYSEPLEKDFRATAHKLRLTQEQAAGISDWFNQFVMGDYVTRQNAMIQNHNQTVDQFKQELGENYETKMNLAEKIMTEAGGQELRDYLDATGLGSHPAMVKAWLKVSDLVSEGAFVDGSGGGSASKSDVDALAELNRHPALLNSAWQPGEGDTYKSRKEVLAARDKLFDKVYGVEAHQQ